MGVHVADQLSTFGSELRRLRVAAGLSLAELARRVHYSKGYLGKIETGDKPAGMGLARRCDTVLDAGGQLAALVAPVACSGPPAQAMAPVDSEVWVMCMESDGSSRLVPMSRRDALTMGAASLVGLSLGSPGVAVTAQHDTMIAAFRALFEQTRQLGQITSPSAVLPITIAQAHALRGLAASASSPAREELLRLSSRYAEYAGWMAQEAGDDRGQFGVTGAAAAQRRCGSPQRATVIARLLRHPPGVLGVPRGQTAAAPPWPATRPRRQDHAAHGPGRS